MASIALPQGASKALATPKGKAYAAGGVAAFALLAYLLLGGGSSADKPVTKGGAPATSVAPTTAPAAPAPTAPYAPVARNPFLKGDGTQPATE